MGVTTMGIYQDIIEKIQKGHRDAHKRHEVCNELHRKLHRKKHKFHKHYREFFEHKTEFHRYHRQIKYTRPFILVFNFLIWYLLFRYAGIKVISISLALLFGIGAFSQFFFLHKIENRILRPINKLKNGVEEITRGNYDVEVENNVPNEIGLLIDSFNEMAQKLQESERMKAEYEANRKALIANISHDLKTPITSIQGYIEAIMDENAVNPENINKYLKIIYSNSAYINRLIDDLFLFSKLDMQKLEFQFIKVEVRPFLHDLMEEFKLELEENEISFQFIDMMKNDCSFNIDRKRLYQVFRNIIGNAVKYGPEQNLSIKTELYLQDEFVCIDIRDNGPGISEDKLSHIFDRFYRIDKERTKDLMSTGLGLAIAKELVEAHGGKIIVSSKENEGTCFTIMLPVI